MLTDTRSPGARSTCPFDAAAVRAAVEERIAETNRRDVEFAVATHVEPYGQTFVCSVGVRHGLTKPGTEMRVVH